MYIWILLVLVATAKCGFCPGFPFCDEKGE